MSPSLCERWPLRGALLPAGAPADPAESPLARLGLALSPPAPLCSLFPSRHPAGLIAGGQAANGVRPRLGGAPDALALGSPGGCLQGLCTSSPMSPHSQPSSCLGPEGHASSLEEPVCVLRHPAWIRAPDHPPPHVGFCAGPGFAARRLHSNRARRVSHMSPLPWLGPSGQSTMDWAAQATEMDSSQIRRLGGRGQGPARSGSGHGPLPGRRWPASRCVLECLGPGEGASVCLLSCGSSHKPLIRHKGPTLWPHLTLITS